MRAGYSPGYRAEILKPGAKTGGQGLPALPISYRIQHIIMMLSFLTLSSPGFPSCFPESSFFKGIFSTPGSFQLRGLIHRGAAIVLITWSWCIPSSCFPRGARAGISSNDAQDQGLQRFQAARRFQPGSIQRAAAYARFNFIEKFEYLAVVWGSIVMGVTGFVLWFPDGRCATCPSSA